MVSTREMFCGLTNSLTHSFHVSVPRSSSVLRFGEASCVESNENDRDRYSSKSFTDVNAVGFPGLFSTL